MGKDPKSAKRQSSHHCLFALLGYAGIKSVSKHNNTSKVRHLGSILPIFYAQLLWAKIPKVQKDKDDLTVFLRIGI
jgi:hypothetical protein